MSAGASVHVSSLDLVFSRHIVLADEITATRHAKTQIALLRR